MTHASTTNRSEPRIRTTACEAKQLVVHQVIPYSSTYPLDSSATISVMYQSDLDVITNIHSTHAFEALSYWKLDFSAIECLVRHSK
jgi:hypothetical protein